MARPKNYPRPGGAFFDGVELKIAHRLSGEDLEITEVYRDYFDTDRQWHVKIGCQEMWLREEDLKFLERFCEELRRL